MLTLQASILILAFQLAMKILKQLTFIGSDVERYLILRYIQEHEIILLVPAKTEKRKIKSLSHVL